MEIPIFDRAGALERVDSDIELLRELVEMCKGQAAAKVPVLQTHMQQGESLELGSVAHSLKSAFGNVGAMRVHRITFELEKAGKDFRLQEVPKLLQQLDEELKAFFDEFATQQF